MKQPRPLQALNGLSSDQLDLLAHWVEVHSYRKAVELAHEKFDRCIPKTTLQRFMGRRRSTELLEDSQDALQAAREINHFAATAETHFSDATLHLLERQAFELALAKNDKEDFQHLKDILFLLQRQRSNDIHDRRVRVQEEKLALRKAEQENENKTDADGGFSAAVDRVLKNHPVFLAGEAEAAAAPADPDLNRNRNLSPPSEGHGQEAPIQSAFNQKHRPENRPDSPHHAAPPEEFATSNPNLPPTTQEETL